jgi:hypothetical protein
MYGAEKFRQASFLGTCTRPSSESTNMGVGDVRYQLEWYYSVRSLSEAYAINGISRDQNAYKYERG